ncbi:substrate-binding periplasmic protein [Bdellovibrio svalbardensis]|uniref:Transporter substrate-binding domain-containing protein n=1 Tax=Bdellovibrio svalbardensis TaxID=2972972 RepID=A0ABT6DFZ9_9BACT|nr:transporter substrate-binding domain-containing protein [Bdellovibrio svalbardensis]MDG0815774.1 transporter substrate-binding domain-containing protein [Bdellovibrio svalbardensis]
MSWKHFITSVLPILFFLTSSSALAQQKRIKIALSEDYYPWSYGQLNKVQGMSVDILKEILEKQMNYQVQYVGLPWSRAQEDAFRGKYDALCSIASEKRLKFMNASKHPVFRGMVRVYIRNTPSELAKVKGIQDLKSLTQAPLIFNIYVGAGWAADHLPASKIEYSSSIESSIRKLVGGHGDVVVDNSLVVRYYLKKMNLEDKIKEIPIFIDNLDFYFLVNKNSKFNEDFEKFNKLFLAFSKTKAYRDILSKYPN